MATIAGFDSPPAYYRQQWREHREKENTMTTISTTYPASVSELSDIVAAFYDSHAANPPARLAYDAVARALGVAESCTGNSDTAAESVTHTPKSGLSVAFYSVNPTHRTETDMPLDAYYVATWKGATYRGHVVLSRRGYHADTPNGFLCWDRSAYTAVLPDGCRKLVAELVTSAVIESGVDMGYLRKEWQDSATHYELSSQIHAAKMALDGAARIENRGR